MKVLSLPLCLLWVSATICCAESRLTFHLSILSVDSPTDGIATITAIGKEGSIPIGFRIELDTKNARPPEGADGRSRIPVYIRGSDDRAKNFDAILRQKYGLPGTETLYKPRGYEGRSGTEVDTLLRCGGALEIGDAMLDGKCEWFLSCDINLEKSELTMYVDALFNQPMQPD